MARNRAFEGRGPSLLAMATALVVAAGCSAGSSPTPPSAASSPIAGTSPGATSVSAKLSEFKIELGATTAPAGPVTFAVTNGGTTLHEFVVLRTDLAPDKLPLTADGT